MAPKQGLFEFWKGYLDLKSADTSNDPRAVRDLTAEELAILPHYYVMPLELGIYETVAQDMTEEEIEKMHEKSSRWLSEAELDICVNDVQASKGARAGFVSRRTGVCGGKLTSLLVRRLKCLY